MYAPIKTPEVFGPLWERHARYKGVWGGRGSGKSHDRAMACVVEMLQGKRIVGVREVQKSIKDSVKQLVEDKIAALNAQDEFTIMRDEIRGPNGALMIFRGLQDHTAASIKSLEGFDIAWIEEAQTITQKSLDLLTPTIRKPGSELWFTWNPEHEHDPVDRLLRGETPPENAVVIKANWYDNPFFPQDLRRDMERDKRDDPEKFEHVWNGGYRRISAGAYYAKELAQARIDGRMTTLPIERGPLIHTAWDLGIDDTTAIWVCQVVGRETRVIDYYEANGEDAAHYARWVRERGYDTGEALLPHDAGYREKGTAKTYEQHLNEAGLKSTRVLPRTNDLLNDIQTTRQFLARCWFDEQRCKDGIVALGSYRREFDDNNQTYKPKPVHDWASHAADAMRALATGLRPEPMRQTTPRKRRNAWAA